MFLLYFAHLHPEEFLRPFASKKEIKCDCQHVWAYNAVVVVLFMCYYIYNWLHKTLGVHVYIFHLLRLKVIIYVVWLVVHPSVALGRKKLCATGLTIAVNFPESSFRKREGSCRCSCWLSSGHVLPVLAQQESSCQWNIVAFLTRATAGHFSSPNVTEREQTMKDEEIVVLPVTAGVHNATIDQTV